MKKLNTLAVVLLWIGGLNMGLAGVADFNLLGVIFGNMPFLIRTVYVLIGLAAVYQIFHCKACLKGNR
jgi:uncharacterized protein